MSDLVRELIFMTVDDLVGSFLYYDRKEDEELPRGTIEGAIEDNVITVDQIVDRFRSKLEESL